VPVPAILEYFESDEGKREFAEWRTKREGKSTDSEEVSGSAA
jgi:hypothetical protein